MDQTLKEEEKTKSEVGGLISRDRVVTFADSVFAFAATLLVLKIELPQVSAGVLSANYLSLFSSLWPQYLANIISFLAIGYYWLNHHAIFGQLKKFNSTIVWMNLFFLIFVSFLPFPVDLYGDYPSVGPVVAFYCASLALVGFMLCFIWWYASSNHRLITSDLSRKTVNFYTARNLVAPIVFVLSIPLVLIHPGLTQASWVLIIVGTVLINKYFHQKSIG